MDTIIEFKCCGYLHSILPPDEFSSIYKSIGSFIGADMEKLSDISALFKLNNTISKEYSCEELEEIESIDINCQNIAMKYDCLPICYCCKNSKHYKNTYTNHEIKILCYCMRSKNELNALTNYINSKYKSKNLSLNDIFCSYIQIGFDYTNEKFIQLYKEIYCFYSMQIIYKKEKYVTFNLFWSDFLLKHPNFTTQDKNIIYEHFSLLFNLSENENMIESEIFELLDIIIIDLVKSNNKFSKKNSNLYQKNHNTNASIKQQDKNIPPNKSVPKTLIIPPEEPNFLNKDGFIEDIIIIEDFSKIQTLKDTISFRNLQYDLLRTKDIAIEYIVDNDKEGILLYLIEDNIFYFIDLCNPTIKPVLPFISNILKDTNYLKITFFGIPLISYLYKNNMKLKNYTCISEMFSLVYPNKICTPLNVLRVLLGERLLIGKHFYLFAMPYYRNLYRKFYKMLDEVTEKALKQQCNYLQFAGCSYRINDLYSFEQPYINRLENGTLIFHHDKLPKQNRKKGIVIAALYRNDICEDILFHTYTHICSKFYTGKLLEQYDLRLLQVSSQKGIIIFTPEEAYRSILSLFNHWFLKIGKQHFKINPDIYLTSSNI